MAIESLIIHDVRSTHNVGSILRTCDGFGVTRVYIGGITPYPLISGDTRLPHISSKLTSDIHKTALGAEETVEIIHYDDINDLLATLKNSGLDIIALEQSPTSIQIDQLQADGPIALLVGREVEGVDASLLEQCDNIVEIPMKGKKESFNVSVAVGIALYAMA